MPRPARPAAQHQAAHLRNHTVRARNARRGSAKALHMLRARRLRSRNLRRQNFIFTRLQVLQQLRGRQVGRIPRQQRVHAALAQQAVDAGAELGARRAHRAPLQNVQLRFKLVQHLLPVCCRRRCWNCYCSAGRQRAARLQAAPHARQHILARRNLGD